jgi:hypothetical protein
MIDWIKEHPYLTGSAIVGILILYFVYRSKSAPAGPSGVVTVGPSDSVQAMALNANAGIQAATLHAQETVAGYSAAVQAKALETAASTQIATLKTQLGLAQIGNQVPLEALAVNPNNPGLAEFIIGRGTVAADQTAGVAAIAPIVNAAVDSMPTPTNPGTSAHYTVSGLPFIPPDTAHFSPAAGNYIDPWKRQPLPGASYTDPSTWVSVDTGAPLGYIPRTGPGYAENAPAPISKPVPIGAPTPAPTNNVGANAAILQAQLGYNPSTLLPQDTYLAQLSAQQHSSESAHA